MYTLLTLGLVFHKQFVCLQCGSLMHCCNALPIQYPINTRWLITRNPENVSALNNCHGKQDKFSCAILK